MSRTRPSAPGSSITDASSACAAKRSSGRVTINESSAPLRAWKWLAR